MDKIYITSKLAAAISAVLQNDIAAALAAIDAVRIQLLKDQHEQNRPTERAPAR